MATDKFPNIFVAVLKQSLALGGSETEAYLSTVRTLDGQTIQTSDFAYLGRGILSADIQSASRAEFMSFTGVDSVNSGFTGLLRGLSFNSNDVIAANKKFHAVGAPVIIAFGTHNLIDLEGIIQANYASIEAQITALIAAIQAEYLALNGSNFPTGNIGWAMFRIINLGNGVNPQDAVTLAQLNAAVIAGGIPATTSTGGYVKVATQAEFLGGTNTTVVGPFTFYNMPTVQQVLSVGTGNFVYGENITALNYVFQASGNEVNYSNSQQSTGSSRATTGTAVWEGGTFASLANAQPISGITLSLEKTGSPTGTAVLKIFALSGGLPTGAPLATSNPLNVATLTTGFVNTRFTFATPFVPAASTTYAMVLDPTGVTFSGGTIPIQISSSAAGAGGFQSVDGGATYPTTFSNNFYYIVNQLYTPNSVYNVSPGNILPEGPYKGFAVTTALSGTTNAIQLSGVLAGFTALAPETNVYVNPSVPGGTSQTLSISSGRCVGIAISATQVQLSPMKRRDAGISYSANVAINQDGFLLVTILAANNTVSVVESNPQTGATATVGSVQSSGTTSVGSTITVPVRAGYSYNQNGTFYPLING